MAKILTIKIKDNIVDIKSHLPEGMTEEQVHEHLATALPMAVAGLAVELSGGLQLAARAAVLDMFEAADDLLNEMLEEEDCHECGACCCEGDDCPDH